MHILLVVVFVFHILRAIQNFKKYCVFFRLYKVKTIKIVTYPVKNFLPLDIHFEIPVDKNQKEISFNHPLTGTTHKNIFSKPRID